MLTASGIASLSLSALAGDIQRQPLDHQFPTSSDTSTSTTEMFAMVKKPSTLIELLSNIKVALDNGLLIQDSFYSEANLKHFFGANKISWRAPENDPGKKWVNVSEFGDMVKPVTVGNNVFSGIDCSAGKTVNGHEKTNASVKLLFMGSEESLSFEKVVQLFGPGWQQDPYLPFPPSGKIFKTPTHPHGNERIKYVYDNPRGRRSIEIEFGHDGTLYTINFLDMEVK